MSVRTSVELEKCGTAAGGPARKPVRPARAARDCGRRSPGAGGAGFLPDRPGLGRRSGQHAVAADATHPSGRFVRSDLSDARKIRPTIAICCESPTSAARRPPMHDPYAFPPLLTDYDLYLLGEGQALAQLPQAGRSAAHDRRRRRGELRRLGAERHRRQRDRRLQHWDGRRHPMRKHIPSGFWELFVPGLGEGTLYKYQVRARRPGVREVRSLRLRRRSCRRAPPRRSPTSTATTGTTSDWMANRQQTQRARRADVDLRSPPGKLAPAGRRSTALAHLSRTGPPAGRLLPADGLHAPRAAAGQRASVLGQLGLSDGRLLSPPPAATARRKTSCTSSIIATRTASA